MGYEKSQETSENKANEQRIDAHTHTWPIMTNNIQEPLSLYAFFCYLCSVRKKEKQSMPQQTKSKPNNTREEKEQER